jgi:hypothetical protein
VSRFTILCLIIARQRLMAFPSHCQIIHCTVILEKGECHVVVKKVWSSGLWCCVVQKEPAFWRNILLPSSGSESKPIKKPAETDSACHLLVLVSCLAYSSFLKICSSEMSGSFQSTVHYSAEDNAPHHHHLENLNLKKKKSTVIFKSAMWYDMKHSQKK